MTELEKNKYEQAANKLLEKLKANNPDFDLQVEYGRLLMKHIDSLTVQERQRYDELTKILTKK